MQTVEENIEENTVTQLSDRRVGAANIWVRTYDRGGTPTQGVVAWVSVSDGQHVEDFDVGLGTRLKIGNDVYECVAIHDGRDEPPPPKKAGTGSITLRLSADQQSPTILPRVRPPQKRH